MTKYISGAIIAIIFLTGTFFTGLYIGKTYFPKEIKVQGKTVTKTVYKYKYLKPESNPVIDHENFDRLLYCYDSPLLFEDHTENITLHVTCKDDCKEATASYKIGVKHNYAIYFSIAAVGVGSGILLYHMLK